VLDGIGLDRPPLGETFWSLLGAKDVGTRGWRTGPEALEPPEAMGSFVFLCHALNMTLSEEQLARALSTKYSRQCTEGYAHGSR
jgi:hypothetical protein